MQEDVTLSRSLGNLRVNDGNHFQGSIRDYLALPSAEPCLSEGKILTCSQSIGYMKSAAKALAICYGSSWQPDCEVSLLPGTSCGISATRRPPADRVGAVRPGGED